jgi:hypothetical protein
VRGHWLLLPLGFGVLALGAFRGEPDPAPDALAASLLQPSDSQISESTAQERCEAAIARAPPGGVTPQFSASAAGSRRLDGGRSVKVKFSAKNPHNIDLDFRAWCVVWDDGRPEITSIIETAGRDFLASSHPPSVRNAYLQKVKASKSQGDARRFYTVITNRNEFSIKGAEVVCRINEADSDRYDDKKLKIERVIPGGGSTTFRLPRTSEKQSMMCRVTDFLKVGADEQRLIDAFGPAGGETSYARLQQDAMRVGVPVNTLVEPFITFARTLASNQR